MAEAGITCVGCTSMVTGPQLPLNVWGPLLLSGLKKWHSWQVFSCQGKKKKKKHLSLINPSLGFIGPSACSLQSMFSLSDAVLEASSLACKQVIASRALGGITWALEGMEVAGRPVDFLSRRVKDGALVGV